MKKLILLFLLLFPLLLYSKTYTPYVRYQKYLNPFDNWSEWCNPILTSTTITITPDYITVSNKSYRILRLIKTYSLYGGLRCREYFILDPTVKDEGVLVVVDKPKGHEIYIKWPNVQWCWLIRSP